MLVPVTCDPLVLQHPVYQYVRGAAVVGAAVVGAAVVVVVVVVVGDAVVVVVAGGHEIVGIVP